LLLVLGGLWRRAIWDEVGGAVEKLAVALGGEIRPLWAGWRVQTKTVRVDWVGGLFGVRTRIRTAESKVAHQRLMTSGELLAILRE
jgi:hypothetical protein